MNKIYWPNIKIILLILLISFSTIGFSQELKTQINGFGHFDSESTFKPDTSYHNFALGEQDLFINSRFNNKFSFLGEITLKYSESTDLFVATIERARLKYNFYRNHSIIIGKVHTPVNFWNDVFHHGRLFFPTIDRPTMFSNWIPIHTFGMRLQGQNLGNLNFGYDVVIGNGMASLDKLSINDEMSLTLAAHLKPVDGIRLGGAYYYNRMNDASIKSRHSGHHSMSHHDNKYDGALDFHLMNFSFAYFGNTLEILNEFSLNITNTDSLSTANNLSNYLYIGYRIKDKHVPFLMLDYLVVDENDLHTYMKDVFKFSIGYKHEFSHLLNLKFQIERYTNLENSSTTPQNKTELKLQLSYGF